MQRCYLDNNATTSIDPRALEEMIEALRTCPGNPSSTHDEGTAARELVEQARARVAECLSVPTDCISFTGGGTEANNIILTGACLAARARPVHVVTSAIEHASVLETCWALESRGLAEVTYVAPTRDGHIRPHDVESALRPTTGLVSIMAANNETGALMQIADIVARAGGVPVHTDAIQVAGKEPLRPAEWGVDFMTLSAHKFHGPKGVGVIYRREGAEWKPVLHGGDQEFGMRPGTENVAGIVGTAAAFESSEQARLDSRCSLLRAQLWNGLNEQLDELTLNTPLEGSVANTLNVSFNGIKADALLLALNLAGVAASTGSACHAQDRRPSHVLMAMGREEKEARSAIRFSLSRWTTETEIEHVIRSVCEAVGRLRRFS